MSRVLPILFSTEMVQAILDGRKTVTRRVMKLQPWKIGEGEHECRHEKGFFDMGGNDWACRQCGCGVIPMKGGSYFHAPYQPGDILYVRETWAQVSDIPHWNEYTRTEGHIPISPLEYVYKADNVEVDGALPEIKWHPSIHMPKEAARIWLKVTDVRVERLQEIDDDGVLAEGLEIGCFIEDLWNSTIKKSDLDRYGWDADPWVWVIEFERCGKPEKEGGDE